MGKKKKYSKGFATNLMLMLEEKWKTKESPNVIRTEEPKQEKKKPLTKSKKRKKQYYKKDKSQKEKREREQSLKRLINERELKNRKG